jgi:serine/threonine protein kinase
VAQMLTFKGHRMNVDLWGLGCLAYELVVGSPPFGSCLEDGHNVVYKQILANKLNVPTFTVDAVGFFLSLSFRSLSFLLPPFGSCLEDGHNVVYKQILANKLNVPTFTVDAVGFFLSLSF